MSKPGILRFVYNNNPFYLISACVLLYGLNTSLPPASQVELVWILSPVFAAYTILMAITACLIVRLGKVWDDARTILLVMSLMFFAISVSFDQLCVTYPRLAAIVLALGLVFCLLITELTVLGLRLKLPTCYRLPLHLLLLVIFGFPLSFAAMGSFKLNHDAHWILLSFPLIAALSIMTLIPAARAGRKMVAKNGSPWIWPYYPWSLFGLIVIGLCGRCVLLCIAFEPSKGLDSIFDLYMIVPIFLAVLFVLLEIAIRENKVRLQQGLMMLAMLSIPMSMTWNPSFIQYRFLDEVILTIGSPLWLTTIALTIFYSVAWLRDVDKRAVWLSLSFVMAAICSPLHNQILSTKVSVWPIFCLSVFMFVIGLSKLHSRRFLASSVYAAIGTGIFLFQNGQPVLSTIVAGDVLVLGMLMIGVANHDVLARRINALAAVIILFLGGMTILLDVSKLIPREILILEFFALLLFAVSSFVNKKDILLILSFVGLLLQAGVYTSYLLGNQYLDEPIFRYLVAAMFCFFVGALISAMKAGLSKLAVLGLQETAETVRARIAADF